MAPMISDAYKFLSCEFSSVMTGTMSASTHQRVSKGSRRALDEAERPSEGAWRALKEAERDFKKAGKAECL